ncbi:excinuclease ABC subunit UvrA, partial [Candidatus Woesearchaeota archaeon]|nr:excinuclease ABC subunit UvrA [Candidatus Woesearchaeota archaeon]
MKKREKIAVSGAREHNLKNISFEIPRNQLTSLVGVSGSGKSTIAFDLIFSEGQRQYLESISTYARKFLRRSNRPDVDSITGLSPAVVVEQKVIRGTPRSTVGTRTEIYSYFRLLFSRFGSVKNLSAGYFSFNSPKGACEKCKGLGTEYTIDPNAILDFDKSLNEGASRLNNYKPGARLFNIIKLSGKVDMDKPIKKYSKQELDFLLYSPRVVMSNKQQGFVQTFSHEGIINRLIKRASDLRGISASKEKTEKKYWITEPCKSCNGGRLNKKALSSKINNLNIGDYSNMQLNELLKAVQKIKLPAKELLNRIIDGIRYLVDVELGYLCLNRGLDTLSGGETQRLKLARELGSDLIEMVYVLDEPTTGLHPKNVDKMVEILVHLRDMQNTVLVVEHDPDVILASDHVLEIGPGAGKLGGRVVAEGMPKSIMSNPASLTGKYLSGKLSVGQRTERRAPKSFFAIQNASLHNLKNVSAKSPTGILTAITGVSG